MSKVYDKGDTPFIVCEHETYNLATDTWVLANPDAGYPKATLIEPITELKKLDAQVMDLVVEGKFQYPYEIELVATAGWWKGYIDVKNGGHPTRERFGFEVK